jgi:hypothetical protein
MSPEQVRGEKLDGRSDLFSLGVVLYELLTSVRPFPGESITTLVYQILHTEPRDPLELKANLPTATREVMARLLAKQSEKRPADARAFLQELSRIESIQRESEMTRRAVAPGADRTLSPAAPTVRSAPSTESAARRADSAASTTTDSATTSWPPPPPTVPPSSALASPPSLPSPRPCRRDPPRRTSGLPILLLALAVLVLLAGVLLLRGRGERGGPESVAPRGDAGAAAPANRRAPRPRRTPRARRVPYPPRRRRPPRTRPPRPSRSANCRPRDRARPPTRRLALRAGSERPRPTPRHAAAPTPVEVARAEPAPPSGGRSGRRRRELTAHRPHLFHAPERALHLEPSRRA